MTEMQQTLDKLLVRQLETMTDSQFLGFTAMMFGNNEGPLAEYTASRLDMIALKVGAEEAKEALDDGRQG